MRPKKNSQSRNQVKSPHFTDHRETSQPICSSNQLTGFYKRQTPIKRYLKIDWVPLCGLWALTDNRSIKKWQVAVLCVTYLIDVILTKFTWAVLWLPKFNFRFKFVNRTTFFLTSWNAAPNSWCNKRSSFNAISNSVDISRLKLGFVS